MKPDDPHMTLPKLCDRRSPALPTHIRHYRVRSIRVWWAACLALGLFGAAGLQACSGGTGVGGQDGQVGKDGGADPDADLCGVGDDEKLLDRSARVYHGTTDPEICMTPSQQLSVGALLFQDYNWENACTGTLVSDNVVLTAAHCVEDYRGNLLSPNEVRFAVGANSSSPVHVFFVADLAAHPEYQGEADHDVGVLVLSGSASSAGIQALPIPANTRSLNTGFLGEWVQNVGYGATHDDENNTRRFWTTEEVTQVQSGEFTVYGQGVSSVCYGDSGGPSLFLFGGSSLAVVGTVSWGDPSCMDYDHFARVDDSLAFIETYTGTLDPCMGIGSAGRCEGNVALWCEGGELQQRCCGDEGLGCQEGPGGLFRCADSCQGLDFLGACDGQDAVWCEGGQVRRRRCIPCDQVCGWAGDLLGYYCLDP
ncbi:MAG: trypsin-like serine protease [Polyangia bacterium]|nr:trypsin-like serine protease [Polyangia bacterium]